MKDLTQLRQQIDAVDQQIVELFEQRMRCQCRRCTVYKIANGKKVFDKEREHEKLDKAEGDGTQ